MEMAVSVLDVEPTLLPVFPMQGLGTHPCSHGGVQGRP